MTFWWWVLVVVAAVGMDVVILALILGFNRFLEWHGDRSEAQR